MSRIRPMFTFLIVAGMLTSLRFPLDGVTQPGAISLPPTTGVFDYQLGGAYDFIEGKNGGVSIDVVVRNPTEHPLSDAYNICYVNGFQTQPDGAEFWLERSHLLLHDEDGELLIDPNWPDEYIFDPGTPVQREELLEIIGETIEGCAETGFDAVEIDNLDTFSRFDQIDQDAAMELARGYVEIAHGLGLAIGQKNTAELSEYLHEEIGFDFAIVESCAAWGECGAYADVYGEHALQIEYPDELEEAGLSFADVCALPNRAPLTILRDRDLVGVGELGYVYEACNWQ